MTDSPNPDFEAESADLAQKRIAAEWAAMKLKEITERIFSEARELRARAMAMQGSKDAAILMRQAGEKQREAQAMLDNQQSPEYSEAVSIEVRLRKEFEFAQAAALRNAAAVAAERAETFRWDKPVRAGGNASGNKQDAAVLPGQRAISFED